MGWGGGVVVQRRGVGMGGGGRGVPGEKCLFAVETAVPSVTRATETLASQTVLTEDLCNYIFNL